MDEGKPAHPVADRDAGAALLFRNRIANLLLPPCPLVELSGNELPAVQNSFHSFVYSVFRGGMRYRSMLILRQLLPTAVSG